MAPPADPAAQAAQAGTAAVPPTAGIVIPTYNRWPVLRTCLEHLERQTTKDFQVVVLDDGSTDETAAGLERYGRTAPFQLLCLRQTNAGQAAARNRAIAQLRSPVTILIGDDTFPQPAFAEAHLRFHREHPQAEAVTVGYTGWAAEGQTVTPLMRWIGEAGPQFHYGELQRGKPAGWEHFYTSNLSAKTAYLQAHPFVESFPGYGFEDVELGYRLAARAGLQMHFLPQAVAEHLHPTTFAQVCARARQAGRAEYHFAQLWPERAQRRPSGVKGALLRLAAEPHAVLPALTAVARLWTAVQCPNPLLPRVLQLHGMVGYDGAAATDGARQAS